MACNATRIELSNSAATTVQITVSSWSEGDDELSVTLEVDGLAIDETATTSSGVATMTIAAVTAANNSLWDATLQVGNNRIATAGAQVVETNVAQTVGITVSDADVTYCAPTGGGGGGVTDHGALTGLGDDDHTQYALASVQERRYSKNLDINAAQMVRQRASLLFLGDSINNPTQGGYMRSGYAAAWSPDYWRGISPGHSNGNPAANGWLLTAASGANITGLVAGNGPDPNLPGLETEFSGRQSQPGAGQWYNQIDDTGGNTSGVSDFEMARLQPSSTHLPNLWLGTQQGSGVENTYFASDRFTMRTLWYAKSATSLFADYRGISSGVSTTESIALNAGWNLIEKEIGSGTYVTPQYVATRFYSTMQASTDSAQLVASYVFSPEFDGMSMAYMGGGGWKTANHRYEDDTAPTIAGSGGRSCWYLDETAEQVMTMMDTDIVVIQTGANESLAEHTANLAAVIDRFRAIRPGIRFLLVSQYWISDTSRWSEQAAFQRALAGSTGYRDVAFLDLHQMVVDNVADFATFDSTYLDDGVHPNSTGSEFMAGLEWDEIVAASGVVGGVTTVVGGTGIDVTTVGTTATVNHQDQPDSGVGFDYVRSISIDTLGHVASITADTDASTARQSLGLVIGTDVAAESHVHDAADVTTGTFADARISESSVTQHADAIDLNDLGDVNIATGAGNDGDLVYFNNAGGAGDKFKGVARSSIGLSEFDNDLPAVQDSYLMLIESPADKTYIIDGRVAAARTITNFYAKTSSGTCTATLKNVTDTTTIGTISVTSTGGSAASLSNTAVTENERLSIEISSNSSSADLELVVEYTQ